MPNSINSFFDKIFIISIKRNQNRLDCFTQNNPELNFEVFDGVDGSTLFPSIEFVGKFPKSFFVDHELSYDRCKHWNKGQLGCAMSNLFLQKEIIKRRLKNALILEDDAKLLSINFPVFDAAINELPQDWDLLYLGYNAPTKWAENRFTRTFVKMKHFVSPIIKDGLSSKKLSKNFFSSYFSRHLKIAGVYAGTHAYGLSYHGAKKIVEIDTPLSYGFDTTLMYANYHKLIKGYALRDPLFIPNQDFSTTLL